MPGSDTTTPYFMFEWHKRIQNYPLHSGITRYTNSMVTTTLLWTEIGQHTVKRVLHPPDQDVK